MILNVLLLVISFIFIVNSTSGNDESFHIITILVIEFLNLNVTVLLSYFQIAKNVVCYVIGAEFPTVLPDVAEILLDQPLNI